MKQKMLIVTEALEMNGVLRSLLDFMAAMDRNRYEISLFCFDAYQPSFVSLPSYVKLLPEISGCYMARAPLARTFGWALRHGAFWMLFRRLLCSVLQKRSSKFSKHNLAANVRPIDGEYDIAIAYSMGITWRFVAEKVRALKKILWLHTDYRAKEHIGVWRRYYSCIEKVNALVCVSNGICDIVKMEYPQIAKKTWCVHSVVDCDAILYKAEHGNVPVKSDKLRLVTVGRRSVSKNQSIIPEIARLLRKNGVDFEWYIVGPECSRIQYSSCDGNCDLKDSLKFVEGLSNPYPLMKSADVYVQTSIYEGWGLTVTEALCLDRYVVASKIPSFEEQLSDWRRGATVDIDASLFALAIESAYRKGSYKSVPDYKCPYTHVLTKTEFDRVVFG